jgi:hypothetical protein
MMEVVEEIRLVMDMMRIHEEKRQGPGRKPAHKRDIIKSLLFLEKIGCPIQESYSVLSIFQEQLGLTRVYKPRTLYKYRADPKMTLILERILYESSLPEWANEEIAGTDATGLPMYKGHIWQNERNQPSCHGEYEKLHAIIGTRSLVVPVAKITDGRWHDAPHFEDLVAGALPGSKVRAVASDPAYVSRENYSLVKEFGATPYIKMKGNAVFRPHPQDAYEASVLFQTRFPERFKEIYRWRTKCESGFHACKNIGELLRGEKRPSRRNQELCRLIVHNLRMVIMERYGG